MLKLSKVFVPFAVFKSLELHLSAIDFSFEKCSGLMTIDVVEPLSKANVNLTVSFVSGLMKVTVHEFTSGVSGPDFIPSF